MITFGSRLRQRAKELGISNSEAARRAGLSEGRYAHYITGKREPDLATVVRIAKVLGTSPNWLLDADTGNDEETPLSNLLDRLSFAARSMTAEDLELLTVQAEAIVKLRSAVGGDD